MRDIVRARLAAVETLRIHRQQVSAFMLKHGRTYPRKKGLTMRYLRWLPEQQFDRRAHQIALYKKWSKQFASPGTGSSARLMERELKTVQGDFRAIESSYGEDVLQLIIASSYLSRLISNRRISRYLNESHSEILAKFQSVVSASSVEESDTR